MTVRPEVLMLAYVYIVFAFAFRFLAPVFGSKVDPSLFSFTPVIAALLYFGYRQPRAKLWIPVALLAAGDVLLTTVVYRAPMTLEYVFTWSFYAAAVLLGGALRTKLSVARVAGASLAGSVTFFIVSNFATWLVWDMYPKTLAGLGACYVAALPFFRNALVGDLVFTAVMFGAPVLVAQMASRGEEVGA